MEKVHFMDLSYAMVKTALQRYSFRSTVKRNEQLNPRKKNSVWGTIASNILEANEDKNRTFVSDLDRLLGGRETVRLDNY